MELKQIEAFVWVAWERSYTRAADAIGITQPAVSARVSSLEKELGYALFKHGARDVQVTHAGQTFLRYGEEMLRLAAKATDAVGSQEVRDPARRLRIGSNTAFAAGPLPQWISEFREQTADVPHLTIDMSVDRTPALVPMLRAGALDVAFVSPLMAPAASTTVLHFACPLALVVPGAHELAGQQITLSELAGRDAVGFVRGPSELQLRRIQRALPTEMRVVSRSNSAFVIRLMAEAGAGLAIVPRWIAEQSICSGRLSTVELLDFDLGVWDVAAVRWRDRPIGQLLEELLVFLEAKKARECDLRTTSQAALAGLMTS